MPILADAYAKRGFSAPNAATETPVMPKAVRAQPAPSAAPSQHDWRLAYFDQRKRIVYWIAADTVQQKEGQRVSAVVRTDNEGPSRGSPPRRGGSTSTAGRPPILRWI